MAVAGFVKSLGQVSHSFRLISRIYLSNPIVQGKLLRCASFSSPSVEQKSSTFKETEAPSFMLQRHGMGAAPVQSHIEVHPEVAKILRDSRPRLMHRNWRKPRISARRLAELRKKYIAMGFYWPEKPMADRGLDKTPKGHRYEREKQARLLRIEENMKNMPKIIEDYRKKMQNLCSKRREEKKEARVRSQEAQRLGIHPKDPRGLQAVKQGDRGAKAKKKFQKKKKDK